MSITAARRHISLSSIRDAATAVYRAAVRTPLIRIDVSDLPDRNTAPSELYLKLEVLQPIGSFKIRGAYNVVRQLTPDAAGATASGPSAPATPRRASRSRRARSARAAR